MKKGISAVEFDYKNPQALESIIKVNGIQYVWFTTDFFNAAKGKRAVEVAHGKAVIDICKATGIKYVIYSSALAADSCPKNVQHIASKWDIEQYLSTSSLNYTIIRPSAFMDNFNDPLNYNPLKKGKASMLTYEYARVPSVSCRDIGKASEAIFSNIPKYQGRTIELVKDYYAGNDVAAALTKVSGVPCVYKVSVPKCIQALFLTDLHHMCQWFETNNIKLPLEGLAELVPDAWSYENYFTSVGQFSNGEKFRPTK